MNTIADRIRQIIKHKGISERKFCSEIGVSAGFLNKASDIGSSKLMKIVSVYPEINPTWLLTGEGEMILESELPMGGRRHLISPQEEQEELDQFVKAFAWLICSSYGKKKNNGFTVNSFSELSEIFKSVSVYLSTLQQMMELDVTKEATASIKENPKINDEGNIVIDDFVMAVLDKYMPIYDSLRDSSIDAMKAMQKTDLAGVLRTLSVKFKK